MKRGLAGLALLLGCGLAHGASWADLWSRPEQQTFAQRQQAFTEIQGQQYAAAAKRLRGLSDPVSQYNRGNALAHTGDLKSAIASYDSVLHDHTPDAGLRRDAQHNRDLIEQQMKSQPQSGKSGQQGGKEQQDGKGGDNGKSGDQGKASSGNKDQNKKSESDKEQGGNKPDEGTPDKNGQSGNLASTQNPSTSSQTPETSPQQTAQRAPESPSPAPQSRAAPAETRPGNVPPPAESGQPGTGKPPAESEQARSMDQWLRWIPDDPAGLLRRKFMIEHMRHKAEGQQ